MNRKPSTSVGINRIGIDIISTRRISAMTKSHDEIVPVRTDIPNPNDIRLIMRRRRAFSFVPYGRSSF